MDKDSSDKYEFSLSDIDAIINQYPLELDNSKSEPIDIRNLCVGENFYYNTLIYEGAKKCGGICGITDNSFDERLEIRKQELFGNNYEELSKRDAFDADIAMLLINEAIEDGSTIDLPKTLLPLYEQLTGLKQ